MQAGMNLANRYKLREKTGTVWLADDLQEGQKCVLKKTASFADPDSAQILERIWFPGLPRLLDEVVAAEEKWYVFTYLNGRTLTEVISETGSGLPLEEVLVMMLQAAKILDFLHRQLERPLMHLDLKPANIIVSETGEIGLIDFNSARLFPLPVACEKTQLFCTADYAAPEVLRDEPCPASDIYSLSLSMLEAYTGENQKQTCGVDLEDITGNLSPPIKRLFRRCLCLDPDKRLNRADELAHEIALQLHNQTQMQQVPAKKSELSIASGKHDRQSVLLCIWSNAEFGCELAAFLSESRKTLIIDADLLFPQADMLLELSDNYSRQDRPAAGFDMMLGEQGKKALNPEKLREILIKSASENLYLLFSDNDLHSYEHYECDSFYRLLQLSRELFDCVVLLCSRFIYDAYTCLGLLAADKVLVPLTADLPALRFVNRNLRYLAARQVLIWDKVSYIAFPYRSKLDLSWGSMDELCGGRLYGCISHTEKRMSLKNEKKSYALRLNRQNLHEYRALARKLELAI